MTVSCLETIVSWHDTNIFNGCKSLCDELEICEKNKLYEIWMKFATPLINDYYIQKGGVSKEESKLTITPFFDTPPLYFYNYISLVFLLALPASFYYLLCSTSMLFNHTACHITKFLY